MTVAAAPRLESQGEAGDAERTVFVKGQNLYNLGLYYEAIAVFGDFLTVYPQSPIKDLVLLWLGRCHLRVGNVGAAEQIAKRLGEVPDTQFVSLYEEELRVARQNYVAGGTKGLKIESASVAANGLRRASEAQPVAPSSKSTASNADNRSGHAAPNDAARPKPVILAKTPSPAPPAKAATAPSDPAKAPSKREPAVRIRMEQSLREVAGATFYRLVVVNEGQGVAREIMVSELLTADLQFASSDPAPSLQEPVGRSQRVTFRIAELKPGASRSLRIAVRLRAGVAPEAILKANHSVTYQDSDKKSYVAN